MFHLSSKVLRQFIQHDTPPAPRPLFSQPLLQCSVLVLHLCNLISPLQMSLNQNSLYYLAAGFNLQKCLAGSQCIGGRWAEERCQPLSSCHNTMKHRASVCPENKLSEQEKTLVSGSNLCKSLVCFPFHVGTTSFTFALLFRKFMVFFPPLDCKLPLHSTAPSALFLLLLTDQGRGSCISHVDQWLRMLITHNWIFDAAVFFSLKHIICSARTSADLFTKTCKSDEGPPTGYRKSYNLSCLFD